MLMEREIEELEAALLRARDALGEAFSTGRMEDPDRWLTSKDPAIQAMIGAADGNPKREEPLRRAALGAYRAHSVFADNREGLGIPMFAVTAVACRLTDAWMVRARAAASKLQAAPPSGDRGPRVSVRV